MLQTIIDFDVDEHGDWRAVLHCGHRHHMRHTPPLMSRPWVLSAEGRATKIGEQIDCRECDEAHKDGS
ncbi:MAG TPA: DUF3565 domain-containing protein [Tepidisphaeraceae bacterium]